jgi:hypothetical protein
MYGGWAGGAAMGAAADGSTVSFPRASVSPLAGHELCGGRAGRAMVGATAGNTRGCWSIPLPRHDGRPDPGPLAAPCRQGGGAQRRHGDRHWARARAPGRDCGQRCHREGRHLLPHHRQGVCWGGGAQQLLRVRTDAGLLAACLPRRTDAAVLAACQGCQGPGAPSGLQQPCAVRRVVRSHHVHRHTQRYRPGPAPAEAPAPAGGGHAVPPALHLHGGQRRRQPATTGGQAGRGGGGGVEHTMCSAFATTGGQAGRGGV